MNDRNDSEDLKNQGTGDENRSHRISKRTSPRKRSGFNLDLSSLYNEAAPENSSTPKSEKGPASIKSVDGTQGNVAGDHYDMPEGIDFYLPPEIMRKIRTKNPARGALLNGLDRLRSLLYVLSTFLPGYLVQEKMGDPTPGRVEGKYLKGTLLFSDVSGFTALSERLAVLGLEGAEKLTGVMNRYFSTMLEILSWSGGVLIKFAGDATLVYFPEQENGEQVRWAVRAGLRMFRAMKEFENIDSPEGSISLKMKIGIGTGEFVSSSVGSEKRMEYVIFGKAVHDTMASESFTTSPGQLVVNQESIAQLSGYFSLIEQAQGFYRVEPVEDDLDDFEIKAEKRRARGMMPLDATPQVLIDEMKIVIQQVEAIAPFLAGELINRLVVQGRKRRIDSEFRPTTVLFCNFIGLDELLQRWRGETGITRIIDILSSYFQRMNDIITRFGGIVSRIDPYKDGMKMLVLFGAPVAHEDDTQRAVSASLAMNEEMHELNQRWMKKYKRFLSDGEGQSILQHRMGITSGGTFAGQVGSSTRCEYTVMGDDVNLSARLMGAADMGQILISDRVYSVIADLFIITELSPITVKGKSKPVKIYQVDGARDDTLINRIHRREYLSGRQKEFAQAKQIMQQAFHGHSRQLFIMGPAGIGKSHFADFLIREAFTQNAQVIAVQCRSYTQNTPYNALRILLNNLIGNVSSDSQEIRQNRTNEFLWNIGVSSEEGNVLAALLHTKYLPRGNHDSGGEFSKSELEWNLSSMNLRRRGSRLSLLDEIQTTQKDSPGPGGRYGAFSTREKRLLFQGFSAVLQNATLETPLLFFFEDAHWLDIETRQLIDSLAGKLKENAWFIIYAQRPEENINISTEACQILTLGPLNLEGTKELISQILVSDLAALVQQQSNGNPLFIEQITRWLKRTRQIEAKDLQNVLQTSNILQELVLSSIETLPEAHQEVIKIASVIGYEFRFSEIQCLLSDSLEPATLSAYLRAMIESNLLILNDASIDTLYGYHQALVRDILYNSIPFERRRELHAALASYLRSNKSQRSRLTHKIDTLLGGNESSAEQADDVRIAMHFELAEDYYQAARYYIEAATRAWSENGLLQVERYAQKALENFEKRKINKTESSDEIELREKIDMEMANVCFRKKEYEKANLIFEQLYSRSVQSNRGKVIHKQIVLKMILGKEKEANDLLKKIWNQNWDENDTCLLLIHVWLKWRMDDVGLDEALQHLAERLKKDGEDYPDPESLITALFYEFSKEYQKAFEVYQRTDQNQAAVAAAIHAGTENMEKGEDENAMTWYIQALELLQDLNEEDSLHVVVLYHLAQLKNKMGNSEEAIEDLKSAVKYLKHSTMKSKTHRLKHIKNGLFQDGKLISSGIPQWNWVEIDDEIIGNIIYCNE